jgi:hypothetical protein
MEAAHRLGISQREGARARPGRLREVRCGHDRITPRHAETGLRRAAEISKTVEASRGQPEIALGRRSHCARRGRRRAVRSLEYANTLPAVSRTSNGSVAGAAPLGTAPVSFQNAMWGRRFRAAAGLPAGVSRRRPDGGCCGNRGLFAADDAEQKLSCSAEAPPHISSTSATKATS